MLTYAACGGSWLETYAASSHTGMHIKDIQGGQEAQGEGVGRGARMLTYADVEGVGRGERMLT
jgi:hypothetical protein